MSNTRSSPKKTLTRPIQYVSGVGPQRAALLQKLDVHTVSDALFYFPRDWQDLTNLCEIQSLEENVACSVKATVEEFEFRELGGGRSVLGVLVAQGQDKMRAIWFNQAFMAEKFRRGQEVVFEGKPKKKGLTFEMSHPQVHWLEDQTETIKGRFLPIYRLTEGVSQQQVRQLIEKVLDEFSICLPEVFPPNFLQEQRLLPIQEAVRQIHFPANQARLDQARRRFVFQELFVMQLALGMRKQDLEQHFTSPIIEATGKIDARIRRLLPFELTECQQHVIQEIVDDLKQSSPMNRLLHGEVGSGKTIIALYAMLVAVANQFQTVLMAPTEILAKQHFETFDQLLRKSRVRRRLFVGGIPSKQKAELLQEIQQGAVDLIIGTQALIANEINFHNLGLVIIDEQHKFGVQQRATLRSQEITPHSLVMTATPIPRTLGMTLYGDLDVSTLKELPPGRQPIHTYLSSQDQREKWWEFFRRKLKEGRQGYVITPVIESSEEVASAQNSYQQLTVGALRDFRVGLVHGQLSNDEKDRVMKQFETHQLDVIVATSVVEVGVNIPNATLMVIENGERFGLAALHQLRGRISRGKFPGFCCVFANSKNPDSDRRLKSFEETQDGFELAEVDFQLRGPGSLLGTDQSGMPTLLIADLKRDTGILTEARQTALKLLASDPTLNDPALQQLKSMVQARYGKFFNLRDIG